MGFKLEQGTDINHQFRLRQLWNILNMNKIAVCIFSASLAAIVSADLSSFRVPRAGGTEDSAPVNYEFAYEVKDTPSNNDFGHMENRNGEVAKGSYHVLLPDGRHQRVDYTADENGYMPKINYDGSASAPSYRF